ncbi:MAG: hypothetical protein OXK78_13620 [Caldilineaceae bacterium]|nr:hypothetical protein [Caldilineaceae bacterium]
MNRVLLKQRIPITGYLLEAPSGAAMFIAVDALILPNRLEQMLRP